MYPNVLRHMADKLNNRDAAAFARTSKAARQVVGTRLADKKALLVKEYARLIRDLRSVLAMPSAQSLRTGAVVGPLKVAIVGFATSTMLTGKRVIGGKAHSLIGHVPSAILEQLDPDIRVRVRLGNKAVFTMTGRRQATVTSRSSVVMQAAEAAGIPHVFGQP